MSKDIDFFRHPAAEREWQAQERALRAARESGDRSDDARTLSYRLIDAALRDDATITLPVDFAERLAAQAGRVPTSRAGAEPGLENLLLKLLGGGLLLAGAVFAVLQGRHWLGDDLAAWRLLVNPWLLTLGACLLASQGAELLRRRLH